MRKSVKAAVAGLSTAVCVAILFAAGFFYVLTYAAPMITGLLVYALNKTFSKSEAICVYVSTAVLSLILVPDKESALFFAIFFGYYPIIKDSVEKIKSKILAYIVKLIIFNISLFVVELVSVYVFNIPFFEDGVFSASLLISFTLLMNIAFLLYDTMLTFFLRVYEKKIEKMIKKLLK